MKRVWWKRRAAVVIGVALALALAIAACTDPPAGGGEGNSGEEDEGPMEPQCDEGLVYAPGSGECVEPDVECGEEENYFPRLGRCLDPWGDESGDGVPNRYDNCPEHHNPDQLDSSGDGVGDACDNCPELANADQAYSPDNPVDDRGIIMGDACVPGNIYVDDVTDTSGDGVPDVMDLCPEEYNPPLVEGCECPTSDPYCDNCRCQCPEDHYPCDDGCELGDDDCQGGSLVCRQIDSSGDGVGDECDNCPEVQNPEQVDSNGDGFGDACAPTPTGVDICETQEADFEMLDPNVYIMLDISSSMNWAVDGGFNPPSGESRWELALQGLIDMSEDLADEVRFGLGTFPPQSGSCSDGLGEVLPMDDHSSTTLIDTFSGLEIGGSTPMYNGLEYIQSNDLVTDASDPFDDQRVKTILLVTDGEPNCDPYGATEGGAVDNVVDRLESIADDGISTHILGFAHNTDSLATFAEAGDTQGHYLADDPDSLSAAISDVAALLVDCSYSLEEAPPNPQQIWFSYNGEYVAPDQLSYDASEQVLTLGDEACGDIRSMGVDNVEVSIEMGCPAQCVPEEPRGLCDMWYESCGEEICEPCGPEVCDGQDNNCSGQIDEGCPDCAVPGASCTDHGDCCGPFSCIDGACDRGCYPVGAPCRGNSDCCTEQCAIDSGEDVGQCIPA